MEKNKLKEMRQFKGFTQQQLAEYLNMADSSYCRRESGEISLNIKQWKKLAEVLDVPLSEIYEGDEKQVFICTDNAVINNSGTGNIYSMPESVLENQHKYIAKLEAEIEELKLLLDKR